MGTVSVRLALGRKKGEPYTAPEAIADLGVPEIEDFEEIEDDYIEPEPEPEPPPKRAPPPQLALAELVEDMSRINIREPIQFEFDSDKLLPTSYPILDDVRKILASRADIGHVVIEGHASFEGNVGYNWDLSTRRAASVFRYLVDQGANSKRFSYRGMGEAISRDTGSDESSLASNRRVEFHIQDR